MIHYFINSQEIIVVHSDLISWHQFVAIKLFLYILYYMRIYSRLGMKKSHPVDPFTSLLLKNKLCNLDGQ
jgi:hypothetical protein